MKGMVNMRKTTSNKSKVTKTMKKAKEAPLPKGHKDVLPQSYYDTKDKKPGGVY
jgi:hypothetical protein|nr:MAG TPA: hypothetical protein [Caudoviricetes sp.]